MSYNCNPRLILSASYAKRRRGRSEAPKIGRGSAKRYSNQSKACAMLDIKKHDSFFRTNESNTHSAQETKLHDEDELVVNHAMAKHASIKMPKQKFRSWSDITGLTSKECSRPVAAPTKIRIRQASHDHFHQWANIVLKDPKCQTRHFCEILRTVAEYLQHSREHDKVPEYTEIRSAIVNRCNLKDSWDDHLAKHVRRLIEAVRTVR